MTARTSLLSSLAVLEQGLSVSYCSHTNRPAMAPRARLLFQPAQAPAPVHSSPSPARSVAHQPLPPASPLHAVEGLFSLLPGGGIRVGERAVRVPPGTVIERLEPRAHEAGDGTKGVRWSGSDEQGQPGTWTLWLLGCVL